MPSLCSLCPTIRNPFIPCIPGQHHPCPLTLSVQIPSSPRRTLTVNTGGKGGAHGEQLPNLIFGEVNGRKRVGVVSSRHCSSIGMVRSGQDRGFCGRFGGSVRPTFTASPTGHADVQRCAAHTKCSQPWGWNNEQNLRDKLGGLFSCKTFLRHFMLSLFFCVTTRRWITYHMHF